jgi:hypothetical protein
MLSSASFIGVADGRVTIHFLRKMCLSILTARAIRMWNRGAKRESLKDFKIRCVPRKEPPHNGQKAINPFGTVIFLKKKRKFWHKRPIVLSKAVPDWHLSEFIVRLEAIKK